MGPDPIILSTAKPTSNQRTSDHRIAAPVDAGNAMVSAFLCAAANVSVLASAG